jgi:RNA recognition motif-containing protein
VLTPEQAEK